MLRPKLFLVLLIASGVFGKSLTPKEQVPVFANTIGPFNNPTETYPYYSLPFCEGSGIQRKHSHTIVDSMAGIRKVITPYVINFMVDIEWAKLCADELSVEELGDFQTAIQDDYYFEMSIDDIPLWGYIGETTGETILLPGEHDRHVYLYQHLDFSIGVDPSMRIVSANLSSSSTKRVEITDSLSPITVEFSYSVHWVKSTILYDHRLNSLSNRLSEIHWLSIIDSVVLVLLLLVFLSIILMRILKQDFSLDSDIDSVGWKLIHRDVFRQPAYSSLFTSLISSGAGLLCSLMMLLLAILTPSDSSHFIITRRGALMTALIFIYASFGSFTTGLTSGYLYSLISSQTSSWMSNFFQTSLLFPLPVMILFCISNSIAFVNMSSLALPIETIFVIIGLFLVCYFPVLWIGFVIGKYLGKDSHTKASSAANTYISSSLGPVKSRNVPASGIMSSKMLQVLVGGFLPFSSIYLELHHVFAAIWGHEIYSLFGILSMTLLLSLLVSAFICISLTYFQLCKQDHHWWWRSFINGASISLFIFIYSLVYYFGRSQMNGMVQTAHYFSSVAILCLSTGLVFGSVGFSASWMFVDYIYSMIKLE